MGKKRRFIFIISIFINIILIYQLYNNRINNDYLIYHSLEKSLITFNHSINKLDKELVNRSQEQHKDNQYDLQIIESVYRGLEESSEFMKNISRINSNFNINIESFQDYLRILDYKLRVINNSLDKEDVENIKNIISITRRLLNQQNKSIYDKLYYDSLIVKKGVYGKYAPSQEFRSTFKNIEKISENGIEYNLNKYYTH